MKILYAITFLKTSGIKEDDGIQTPFCEEIGRRITREETYAIVGDMG